MKAYSIFQAAILGLSAASYAQETVQDDLIDNLYGMRAVYRAEYAPAGWKKKFSDYDLDQQFGKALAATQASPQMSLSDARKVLMDFIYAMRDYHTSISFTATEAASLPFTVKSVGDRYFLVYIDRTKLSSDAFPFNVGDEVVSFNGQSTADVVKDIQSQITENVPATDRALAELRLTSRSAARGLTVPQGPVTLAIKPKGEKTEKQIQLIWEYTPEKIFPRASFNSELGRQADVPNEPAAIYHSALFHPKMDVSLADDTAKKAPAENPYNLGTRKSFTPCLGTKVWEGGDSNFFDAYVYKTADRKLIGYVRIASYGAPDFVKAVEDMRKIVKQFEATTDAMIIDQVNNPGGSVFYLYALASLLTDQPLKTPRHRMAITQADVSQALQTIEQLKNVKTDDDAKKALNPTDQDGYPATYEFVQFTLSYAHFIVDQWKAGHKLSDPYWIAGVDRINPDATHYTKPILLLTNHLDFSGGDFFPAILQDNKRVTILGSRTAGAGGYVNDVPVPNNLGVNAFRVTESIAERADGNPIENLGIKPDIEYEMTEEDYTGNYAPYVKKIQETVSGLVK